ncbi:hypothetical protein BDC45DRAFT_531877 [Circinella umbellata]|nr:hypothetical protein BDC45DRAFT_531877 [Circinella umbellata]
MLQQFWKFLKNGIVTPPKNYNNATRYGRIQNNYFGVKAATSVLIANMVSPEVVLDNIHLQDLSITKIKQKQHQSLINGNNFERVVHPKSDKENCHSEKCWRLDNDGYYNNSLNQSTEDITTTTNPSTNLSQKKSLSDDKYNYKYYCCPYEHCTYRTVRPSTLQLHIVHTHDFNFPAFNGNYRRKKVTFSAPDGTRILFDEKSRNTVNSGHRITVAMTTKTS